MKYKITTICIFLLALAIIGTKVIASYTTNQPLTSITAPQATNYIRNNFTHYYNMFSEFCCYPYSNYWLSGFDTSDATTVEILKPFRVLTAAEIAASMANSSSVDNVANAKEGQAYILDNGANDTLYIYDDDSQSYIAFSSGGGSGSISGTRVYLPWSNAEQVYSYITNDYVHFVTGTGINLQQWSNQITVSVRYKADDGLTETWVNGITNTHKLTIDNNQVLRTGKRIDIPIGVLSLDDDMPAEVSQTNWLNTAGMGYKTLLFNHLEDDKVLFDFTVPANVKDTSNIAVDLIVTVGGVTSTGAAFSDGIAAFCLRYSSVTPIGMSDNIANNMSAGFGITPTAQITQTVNAVTVSKWFPAFAVTNTAFLMPLTISSSNFSTLDEIHCIIDRCATGSVDTFANSMRLLNVRVHGTNKNPE